MFFFFLFLGRVRANSPNTICMFLMILGLVYGGSAVPQEDIIQRINYGVVFKEQTQLYLAKESWLHTFKVALPQQEVLSNVQLCMPIDHAACHVANSMITYINNVGISLATQHIEVIKTIHALVPQTKIFDNRQSRSLLPFIGSLAKGLFGTATMEDVNLLARHINALNRRTQLLTSTLHQHGDHLSSFVSLIDKKTANLMHGINLNSRQISLTANAMKSSMNHLSESMISMSQMLVNITNKSNIIRHNLDKFVSAIQTLVEGRISPFLLPKHTIMHTVDKIKTILGKSYPGFSLIEFHPTYYYTNSNFMFTRNHSELFVTLRFPVTAQAKPLRLFKIISLPVPTNNSLTHVTKLLNLPEYLAITHDNEYYLPLSANDLTSCLHEQVITCNVNFALKRTNIPNCVIGLFNNDIDQVSKFCDFRFLPNTLKHDIIELTPTSVLVYQSKKITLDCNDKKTVIPSCHFCIVHLPCKCAIVSNEMFLSPRLVNCYNKTTELSVLHPINLALLQQFFNASKFNNILGDTTFTEPVQFSIPNFKFYSHNISSVLAADAKMHLSLKKMASSAKKDALIFKTLSEPLLSGDISVQSIWPTTNDILIFSCMGTIGLLFLVCIYLVFKTRNMATALLVLQQVSKVKSKEIPSFIYNKLPTSTPTPGKNDTFDIKKFILSEFTWIHASVVLSVLVLLFLCLVLCYLYQTRQKKGTTVILEVTSGGTCVTIPIVSLSLCPSYYDFTVPIVQDVSLAPFPQCRIFVLFSAFRITNKLTNQSVQLPNSFSIGPLTRRKLKTILQQPFCAYVLVTHQGFSTVLSNKAQFSSESCKLYPTLTA